MPSSKFLSNIVKYEHFCELITYPLRYGPEEFDKIVKLSLKHNNYEYDDSKKFSFYINDIKLCLSIDEFVEENNQIEEITEIYFDVMPDEPTVGQETNTEEPITSVEYCENWILTTSFDIMIFDANDISKPKVFIEMENRMMYASCISYNDQSGIMVFVAAGERWAFIYECQPSEGTFRPLFELRGHEDMIESLSVNRERALIATSSVSGLIKIWSADPTDSDLSVETGGIPHKRKRLDKVPTRIPLMTMTGTANKVPTTSVCWLPEPLVGEDGQEIGRGLLVSQGADYVMKLWRVGSSATDTEVLHSLSLSRWRPLIASTSCGRPGLLMTGDHFVGLVDVRPQASKPVLFTVQGSQPRSQTVSCVQWSMASNCHFFTGNRDGVVSQWDRRKPTQPLLTLTRFSDSIRCLAQDTRTNHIVVCSGTTMRILHP